MLTLRRICSASCFPFAVCKYTILLNLSFSRCSLG
jgi:hypothetical protein